jgi:hypothetical protein
MEIDDNTPVEESPFSNDPSVWSFEDDFNLATRTAAALFQELQSRICSSTFRGYPPRTAPATQRLFGEFAEPSEISWFTAAELGTDRSWLPAAGSHVERTLRMLFETLDTAARYFGPDRVRFVYAFI